MPDPISPKETSSWSVPQLFFLALLLWLASGIFHLNAAHAGRSLYRDQHLGTALEYYKTKVDLLKPIIVGFNATNTPMPQELPVWQAAMGYMFKLCGPWFGWANLLSLLLFSTCLYPLYKIARQFAGQRVAAWTLVFFLAQPIIFVYAGEASTDGFSFMTGVWFLYCGLRVVQRQTFFWWLAACVTGTLAALSKLPFFFTGALACFFILVLQYRTSWRAWLGLGSTGGVVLAVFLAWTHYTDHCIAQGVFPFVDLRVSNSEASFWYFGDLHYRLVPSHWLKGGWRILNACFGSFALVALFFYALLFSPSKKFPLLLLWSSFITTLVFTHLVLHHTHYYLMFTPAFALLCALTATDWEKRFAFTSKGKSRAWFAVVALILALSLVQGVTGMKIILHFDAYPYDMAKVIQKYCSPTDKLLIQGGGWGGNELILADRQGLSIWDTKFLENATNYARLKELGFNKLVMVSESPLLTAVQKINPGESRLQRETYTNFMTTVVTDWPTVFRSDDILIKQLP